MVDRIADIWGTRTPLARDERWPTRVDLKLADGLTEADVDRWVQAACVLCSNGCACDIAAAARRGAGGATEVREVAACATEVAAAWGA
jgi:hypothetical protein